MARSGVITLGEVAEPLPMLDVECSRCGRHGRYNTAKLVERFDADEAVQPFQDWQAALALFRRGRGSMPFPTRKITVRADIQIIDNDGDHVPDDDRPRSDQ